jgi:hypothetical protein
MSFKGAPVHRQNHVRNKSSLTCSKLQVVCNKLEGSRWDTGAFSFTDTVNLKFTGVWDPLAVSCGRCDWMTMSSCSTPLACETVEPQSDDEGFSVWLAGTNTCQRCSKLDPSGCNSTETCTSEINYNDDPDVRREDSCVM